MKTIWRSVVKVQYIQKKHPPDYKIFYCRQPKRTTRKIFIKIFHFFWEHTHKIISHLKYFTSQEKINHKKSNWGLLRIQRGINFEKNKHKKTLFSDSSTSQEGIKKDGYLLKIFRDLEDNVIPQRNKEMMHQQSARLSF